MLDGDTHEVVYSNKATRNIEIDNQDKSELVEEFSMIDRIKTQS